jgi:Ca2+-binding RTX toxin-like protein
MATVKITNAFSFINETSADWSATGNTSNSVTFENGFQKQVLSGMTIGSTGAVSGAVVENVMYQGGHELYRVTDLNIDAATLVNLVDNVRDPKAAYALMFGGNDTITGSDDSDGIMAFAGNDVVHAGAGNDVIVGGAGDDTIDGGTGFDIAEYSGNVADYKLERTANGIKVTSLKGEGVDTVTNVERLYFGDKMVAADVDVHNVGGQVLRLYQAAFDRLPDEPGLTYWMQSMNNGWTLESISNLFTQSQEYKAMYGGLSNHDLVTKYYEHILHREPEQGGLDFWTGVLDSKAATVAQVLAAISESQENVDNSVALIGSAGPVLDIPLIHIA